MYNVVLTQLFRHRKAVITFILYKLGLSFNMLNKLVCYSLIFKHFGSIIRLITKNSYVVKKTVWILISSGSTPFSIECISGINYC